MSIQRRKFSKEFKIQIIHEIKNGMSVAQISRQHQIQESMIHMIHKWRKQYVFFNAPSEPLIHENITCLPADDSTGQVHMSIKLLGWVAYDEISLDIV